MKFTTSEYARPQFVPLAEEHCGANPTPAAAAKVIPLRDVSSALMCAVIRLKSRRANGERHGRTAAYTQAPFWLPTCCDMARCRRLGTEPSRVLRQHFSAMHAGDMERVLERTRYERGLQEVRRTWGAGMRTLQREFAGVMR